MRSLRVFFSILQLLVLHTSLSRAISTPTSSIYVPDHAQLTEGVTIISPRNEFTISNNRYTVHFYKSLYAFPVQISAAALTIWYGGIRRVMDLPPGHQAYNTFTKRFGFVSDHLKLTFTPLDPQDYPGNLAMRSMAIAFVEWVQQRCKEGLCELYEASISGPFGAMMVSFELIDGGDETPT